MPQRRTDGEVILLWTLPATVLIWVACFFLFPGFNPPMSPSDVTCAEPIAAVDFSAGAADFTNNIAPGANV